MEGMDIQRCRRMLEAKRAELLSIYRQTEGIAVQKVPDSMEELDPEV
jgi:hypothetical protein